MNDVKMLALTKLFKDEEAKTIRAKVDSGSYEVDTLVHVRGTLKVGDDYDKAPTVSIPLKETLAFVLHRMGVTREKAKEILTEAFAAALAKGTHAKGSLMESYGEEIEAAEKHLKDIIATLPKTRCRGVVKADLEITEILLDSKSKKKAAKG